MAKKPTTKRKRKVHEATNADIRRALTKYGADILKQIPVEQIELSQPVDSLGARILVSVHVGEEEKVPSFVELKIGRKLVSIPIETDTDYQVTKAY
ncbi:MAG TPA: hypothetical protein PKH39_10265 [Woeseiaceae bacterium]|nr:hypothetical protein [Woeseiaceae bacterium]